MMSGSLLPVSFRRQWLVLCADQGLSTVPQGPPNIERSTTFIEQPSQNKRNAIEGAELTRPLLRVVVEAQEFDSCDVSWRLLFE